MASVPPKFNTGQSASPVYHPKETALKTQKTVAVDNTRDKILDSFAERKGFIITNNGGTNCYIGNENVVEGSAAAANGGLLLTANGGSLTMSQVDGYTGEIHAVTAAGSTVVAVLEW